MNKYCRVCWNTHNWREPTGEAQYLESPGSYVHDYGFGHEEWLFNFSWILEGDTGQFQRYGFLQPVNKYRSAYVGQTMHVALYTVTPNKDRVLVAEIGNVYVPDDKELTAALRMFKKNGWLQQMRQDLEDRSISTRGLDKANEPSHLLNVRFRRSDVRFFEPKLLVDRRHKLYRINRYQPVDWTDNRLPDAISDRSGPDIAGLSDPRRSEELRVRAAMEGTEYSPRHVQMQNALYDYLVKRHGKAAIDYEKEFVDLTLRKKGEVTFFELKTALTACRCIRQALGQLLEYSHYPENARARTLIIVGDQEANEDDAGYLRFLRQQYRLPIYYQQWSWERQELLAPV